MARRRKEEPAPQDAPRSDVWTDTDRINHLVRSGFISEEEGADVLAGILRRAQDPQDRS